MEPYLPSWKWDKAAELTADIIHSKIAHVELIYEVMDLTQGLTFPPHIIVSQAYLDLLVEIDHARDSLAPVLITGASGTGKEFLARATHLLSNRSKGPFIAANCGGFTESLLEARLFGYTKGAFTGATTNQEGLFEAANGGTIFLDEIGDMPLGLQVHLLRVLQERTILPIGAPREREVDVRVIAATNRNLEAEVRAGRFREDLFYRLEVFRLHIPPLRDRREEIPYLAAHFLKSYQQQAGRAGLRFSDEAMEALRSYDWPGNVRQLQNEIQRLVSRSMNDEMIGTERLSPEIRVGNTSQPAQPAEITGDQIMIPISISMPYKEALDKVRKILIIRALEETSSNLTQTAERLEIDRVGLQKAINRLGIDVEKYR